MKYNEFKRMMNMIRGTVSDFCRGEMPTLDEAESLVAVVVQMVKSRFRMHATESFEMAIADSVRNEILRACA